MTRYWLKIGIGALLVFAVGMGVKYLIDQGKAKVHVLLDSDQPISIPLKFVDFKVDGARLGQVRRVRLLRTAPKEFSGAEVTAVLDSGSSIDLLRTCQLRIDNLEKMDQNTTFVCVHPDTPAGPVAFEPFGTVKLEGTDVVLTLLLPSDAVRDLRSVGDSLAAFTDGPAAGEVAPVAPVPGMSPPPPPPKPGATSVTP